jgi:hypothetical protein
MSNPGQSPPGASPYGPPPGVHGGMPAASTTQPTSRPDTPDDRITVGPFILSYPHLFVPRPKMGFTPKPGETPKLEYSCELICYSSSPAANQIYTQLQQAANTVSMRKFQRGLDGLKNQPIRSLAEKKTPPAEPGFFLSANTTQKPATVVGDPPVAVVDPEEMYAGCFVYANLTPAAYDVDLSRGVKWYLNSVWKVGDGPRLAPARDAADHYAHLVGKVPMNLAPPVQQPQYAPPVQQYAPPAQQPQYAPPVQQYAPPVQQYAPPGPPTGYPPAAPAAAPPLPGYWAPPGADQVPF